MQKVFLSSDSRRRRQNWMLGLATMAALLVGAASLAQADSYTQPCGSCMRYTSGGFLYTEGVYAQDCAAHHGVITSWTNSLSAGTYTAGTCRVSLGGSSGGAGGGTVYSYGGGDGKAAAIANGVGAILNLLANAIDQNNNAAQNSAWQAYQEQVRQSAARQQVALQQSRQDISNLAGEYVGQASTIPPAAAPNLDAGQNPFDNSDPCKTGLTNQYETGEAVYSCYEPPTGAGNPFPTTVNSGSGGGHDADTQKGTSQNLTGALTRSDQELAAARNTLDSIDPGSSGNPFGTQAASTENGSSNSSSPGQANAVLMKEFQDRARQQVAVDLGKQPVATAPAYNEGSSSNPFSSSAPQASGSGKSEISDPNFEAEYRRELCDSMSDLHRYYLTLSGGKLPRGCT